MVNILVVEDHHETRNLYRKAFASEPKVTLSEVKSVEEAKQYLMSADIPDVIILDLLLPGGSGRGLIGHVRQELGLRQVKILVVTASSPKDDLIALGADVVVTKPLGLRELVAMVKKYAGY